MASKERTKLSAKDIRDLGLWSIFLQISFSFERMQAAGFTAGMLPPSARWSTTILTSCVAL